MSDANPCSECYAGDAQYGGLCVDCELKRLRNTCSRYEKEMLRLESQLSSFMIENMNLKRELCNYQLAEIGSKLVEDMEDEKQAHEILRTERQNDQAGDSLEI